MSSRRVLPQVCRRSARGNSDQRRWTGVSRFTASAYTRSQVHPAPQPAWFLSPFLSRGRTTETAIKCKLLIQLVGVAGFEPATPTSRTWCAASPKERLLARACPPREPHLIIAPRARRRGPNKVNAIPPGRIRTRPIRAGNTLPIYNNSESMPMPGMATRYGGRSWRAKLSSPSAILRAETV
jgi:hypothetical protein